MTTKTNQPDLVSEVEALLSKCAPDGKIRDGASAYLFDMRAPDLLRRLVAEVKALRVEHKVAARQLSGLGYERCAYCDSWHEKSTKGERRCTNATAAAK